MNLPNKLTVLRIFLTPLFAAVLLIDAIPHHYIIAMALFGAASITDLLDGKIARKYKMVTDFGKFADPLADKILVISAFACFVELDIIGAAFMIVVLFREFAVTSIRLVAVENGKVVAANMWGKAKTVSQMVAILAVLLFGYILELQKLFSFTIPYSAEIIPIADKVLLWISGVFTIISGVKYIKDNFEFIKNAK